MITTPEHQSLSTNLKGLQQRVRALVDGLDDATLRRPVLASGWSPLGLLHHLAAMHQFWFRDVLSDEHPPLPEESGPDFGLEPSRPTRDVLDHYARETRNALVVLDSLDLAAGPPWWPEDVFGEWRLYSQRGVVLHVLVELGTHSGQLDTVRELADGRTWSYVLGRVALPDERIGLI